jgi:hypothetical protein
MKKTLVLTACIICTSGVLTQSSLANSVPVKTEFAVKQIIRNTAGGEFEAYVNQARQEIADNDKHITALLNKLVGEKSGDSKHLQKVVKKLVKSIVVLQLANEELRKDLDNYIAYGTGDWQLFKKEFDRELAELNKNLDEVRTLVYEEFIV